MTNAIYNYPAEWFLKGRNWLKWSFRDGLVRLPNNLTGITRSTKFSYILLQVGPVKMIQYLLIGLVDPQVSSKWSLVRHAENLYSVSLGITTWYLIAHSSSAEISGGLHFLRIKNPFLTK